MSFPWKDVDVNGTEMVISRPCLTQGVMDSEDIYGIEFGVAKPNRIYTKRTQLSEAENHY